MLINQNVLASTPPSMRLLTISQWEEDRIWKSQILQSWQVQAQDVMQQWITWLLRQHLLGAWMIC